MTPHKPQILPEFQPDSWHGRLVFRNMDELRAHPSYVRHKLEVSAAKLSALVQLGEMAFRDPLVIAADGTVD